MTPKTMPDRSPQQTLQQRRAVHAWDCIERVPESIQKKYGQLVRGLPSLVQSDGLGQTLAFLKAKDKNKGNSEHIVAYQHVSDWIRKEFDISYGNGETLLEWLLKQETPMYRRASAEVLAYLSWLKRFAEAKGWQEEE